MDTHLQCHHMGTRALLQIEDQNCSSVALSASTGVPADVHLACKTLGRVLVLTE
jgi:hypothetical protein